MMFKFTPVSKTTYVSVATGSQGYGSMLSAGLTSLKLAPNALKRYSYAGFAHGSLPEIPILTKLVRSIFALTSVKGGAVEGPHYVILNFNKK